MATTTSTSGGTTTSFSNTPQAQDDLFTYLQIAGLTEDNTNTVYLKVMANDLGGTAKTLYSVDNGTTSAGVIAPTDLLQNDTIVNGEVVGIGSDTSAMGAKIWVNADGTVGYNLSGVESFQKLAAGEPAHDSFIYAIRLGNGTLSWAKAFVDVIGTNDVPVIGGVSTATVKEDATTPNLIAGGALTITDRDHDQSSFVAQSNVSGDHHYGTFTLGANGAWTYTADNSQLAIQQLGAGQSLTDSFTAVSSDGTNSQTVTITIIGTNDAAVIGSASVTDVKEDVAVSNGGQLTATGSISINDTDTGEGHFTGAAAKAGVTNLGSLSLAANGSYTYSVDNSAVQSLAGSDANGGVSTKVDTFVVTAADGTTKEVSFTIHGANDAAAIGEATVVDVTEDAAVSAGKLTATGNISISDTDTGEGHFTGAAAKAGVTNLGSLSLAANGSYTYSVDNSAVQSLAGSDANGGVSTKVDTFVVTAADGTTKEVSFTIHGANDAAAIGEATVVDVTEDAAVSAGKLTATGNISISDTDTGEGHFTGAAAKAGVTNLGSLSLAANGSYTYSVDNSAVQSLAGSDANGGVSTKVDTFVVTAADGTTKEVSFTIHGANDAAAIGEATVVDVTEDAAVSAGKLTATGNISISDTDTGEGHFTGAAAKAGVTNLGSLSLAANGSYTYSVDNSAVQSLAGSDANGGTSSKIDTFVVTAADGTTKEVSFTIHGANDAAAIGEATVVDVTEDAAVSAGKLTATGNISISDTDTGEGHFTGAAAKAGVTNLGSLSLAANGSYTYSVDNSAVQSLAGSDANGGVSTKVDTFVVTAADGTTKEVSFTIHGANDAAAIGEATVVDVTEDAAVSAGKLTATGNISISDTDTGEGHFTGAAAKAGVTNLGSLSLAANGSYTYSVDNSAVQSLAGSDANGGVSTKVDTFVVTAADGTTKEVSFTIHGANDAAAIGEATVVDVTEDAAVSAGKLTATGNISISDTDTGEGHFTGAAAKAGVTNLGSLSLAANGSYTYSVDNSAVQSLAGSDANGGVSTKVDTFVVTAADGTTKEVSFTIHGANDAAAIGEATVVDVTEDAAVSAGKLTATGNISISDTDTGEGHFTGAAAKAGVTNLGSLSLAANGSYTYSVDNSAVQSLAGSDANGGVSTKVDTFVVTAADGTTKEVSFTIHGANDAAAIGEATVVDVTEDAAVSAGKLTATGNISISDTDTGEGHFTGAAAKAGVTNLGSLSLAANGSYTYSVDNSAVQSLAGSDANGGVSTKVDTFVVTAADGTTKEVSFTIHGANDAAAIGEATVVDVTEDAAVSAGKLTATGNISISDTDTGEGHFTGAAAKAGVTNLGSLSLAANGSYTYSVDNSAVQSLAGSDANGGVSTKVDTFVVTAADGTTKEVSFTIHGANDAAAIGEATVVDVTEDAAVSAGKLTATGNISISDTDTGEGHFTGAAAKAGVTNLGSLSLAANGSYTYSVDNSAVQSLAGSDANGGVSTKVDTFVVTAADGTTKEVSFTIHGANDAAAIGEATVVDVTEDAAVSAGKLTATGNISISDTDTGEGHFTGAAAKAGVTNLGSLSLAANGSYTYSVDNSAVQSLAGSDANGGVSTKVDTFVVTAADGTTKEVSFTIHGANDAAAIGEATVVDVTEDAAVSAGKLTATGNISISDTDTGEGHFTGAAAKAGVTNLGSLSLAANGSYTYSVDNSAVQSLAGSDANGGVSTKVDTFVVTAADGTTKEVSFTIHGANDAAAIGEATVVDVTEDAAVSAGKLTATGNISISDTDTGEGHFTGAAAKAGVTNLGSLSLAANGSYTYSVDNSAVQSLAGSDANGGTSSKIDTFVVTAADGTTKEVSFTIHGANDTAVIGTPTMAVVTEDVAANASGNLTATGTISISDTDQGQAGFQTTVAGTNSNLGSLTLAANGSYSYSVANSAVQYLGTGQAKVDTFTVKAVDGTAKEISFTIFGANETAPDLTLEVTASTSGNQLPSGSFAQFVPDNIGGQGAYSYQMTLTEKTYSGTVISDTSADLLLSTAGVLTAVNGGSGIEESRVYEMDITVTQGTATYSESFSLITGTNSNDSISGGAVTGDDVIYALSNSSGIDVIFAGTGNDTVFGQNGMDEIHGGDGKDLLSGGAGNDTFVFDTMLDSGNVDHIADFTNNEDTILLSHTIFSNLVTTSGALQASEFAAVTDGSGESAAVGSNVHIVYDSKTGNLFYDSDGGSANTGRTLFAVLDNKPMSGSTGFDNNDIKIG